MKPKIYKHINNTDVAMEVVTSYFDPKKNGFKVKVRWLNIVNPSSIHVINSKPVTEFVKQEDVKNWKVWFGE